MVWMAKGYIFAQALPDALPGPRSISPLGIPAMLTLRELIMLKESCNTFVYFEDN